MIQEVVRHQHFCVFLVSLSLVFSFGLHSIQVPHAHSGKLHHHGSEHEKQVFELSEYMHLADKKLYTFVAHPLFAPWTFLASFVLSQRKLFLHQERRLIVYIRNLRRTWNVTFEYLRVFFQRGVLHSKVY
jgi:hypothetical protein